MWSQQKWQTAFDRLQAEMDAGYDTSADGRVILLTGGPLDGMSVNIGPGPLPPLHGYIWGRGTPDELQLWYTLVKDDGATAAYAWDELASQYGGWDKVVASA